MIFGVCTSKSAVVIAETKGADEKFVISASRSIPLQVRSGEGLVELLQTLTTIFGRGRKNPGFVAALFRWHRWPEQLRCGSACFHAIYRFEPRNPPMK